MPERPYTRLTRNRLRSPFAVAVTARSSLWLGQDHLLCIDTNGYTETYKRFYFRDIQALTIVLTQRRQFWNWGLGTGQVFCLAGWSYALLAHWSMGAVGMSLALAVTLLVAALLLFNNLLGPTCVSELRTAVQTEDLASVRRLRWARKLLERLRPLIAAAQAPGGGPLGSGGTQRTTGIEGPPSAGAVNMEPPGTASLLGDHAAEGPEPGEGEKEEEEGKDGKASAADAPPLAQ
jgi:hypothetical protein